MILLYQRHVIGTSFHLCPEATPWELEGTGPPWIIHEMQFSPRPAVLKFIGQHCLFHGTCQILQLIYGPIFFKHRSSHYHHHMSLALASLINAPLCSNLRKCKRDTLKCAFFRIQRQPRLWLILLSLPLNTQDWDEMRREGILKSLSWRNVLAMWQQREWLLNT